MLRAAVARGTEVGKRAQAIMAAGELVPDEVVIGIVADRLAEPDAARGFVLDGFPRTVAQAEALDGVLEAAGRGIRPGDRAGRRRRGAGGAHRRPLRVRRLRRRLSRYVPADGGPRRLRPLRQPQPRAPQGRPARGRARAPRGLPGADGAAAALLRGAGGRSPRSTAWPTSTPWPSASARCSIPPAPARTPESPLDEGVASK